MNTHDVLAFEIERLHSAPARWRETVPVHEEHEGQTVWEGEVEVFELEGHPEADRCYAWEEPENEGGKPKVYAVLHVPPVQSASDAVRASIVARHRGDA